MDEEEKIMQEADKKFRMEFPNISKLYFYIDSKDDQGGLTRKPVVNLQDLIDFCKEK